MLHPLPATFRRDLALPNELLHKIILWVLCDGVHSICTSTADTTWEKNMMSVLHQVSPAFKAISSEIAAKAFDIAKDIRNDDAALLHSLRKMFIYLSLLGTRFRHPSEWGSVSFQTIDCSASSIVFAYALYLSCTSLRRNECRSPRDVFESTHKVILSTLDQSEALCDRVKPVEITWLLRKSMRQEHQLAVLGLSIVQGFNDLHDYARAFTIFQKHVERDGVAPISGALRLMFIALTKVEGAFESYEDILNKNAIRYANHPLEPRAHELPGVLQCLRILSTLTLDEEQLELRERIKKVVDAWSDAYPLLTKFPIEVS